MTDLRSQTYRRRSGWMRNAVVAAIIALCGGAILVLGLNVSTQVNQLQRASSDNTQWVILQTEVEILRLMEAVDHAVFNPGDGSELAEVRKWFNVFYSRIAVLEESRIYAQLLDKPGYADPYRAIRGFLDTGVPLIDGPDDALRAALPAMEASLSSLREGARSMALQTLKDFAILADARRAEISATMVRLAVLTGSLIIMLTVLSFVLSALYRRSEAQAEANRRTSARLATILATSPDPVLVTTRSGLITDFNPAAENVFGHSRQDVIGQHAGRILFPPEIEARQTALVDEMLAEYARHPTNLPPRLELEARRADGSALTVEIAFGGAAEGGDLIVSFLRDVSRQRAAERALNEALDKARAGEKSRADFMAVMSHEMRTPLNGLLGSMQLLSETALAPDQSELVGVMRTSGNMLLHHVNSVLDISRAEAGGIKPSSTAFDLERLVADCLANQAGLAAAARNRLSAKVVGEAPGRVMGDDTRLRQILLNLIGNAVKFTEGGSVTVEMERLPDSFESGEDMVEIRVIDTGIGISEDDISRIFDDFVTLDSSYARKAGGTGLGLGITRRLVAALGGQMGAESEPGEGSVFWLRLPLPAAGAEDAAEAASEAVSPAPLAEVPARAKPALAGPDGTAEAARTILLIEDNEINRFLIRRYLESGHFAVTEAVDGLAGAEAAEAQPFDIILTDISMPRLDGVETSRRIRGGNGPCARTPIIALTAHALPEELDRFRKAGIDECLTKPVTRGDLLAALDRHLRRSGGPKMAQRKTDGASVPLVDRTTLQDLADQIGADNITLFMDRLIADGDRTFQAIAAETEARTAWHLCHQYAGACGSFGAARLQRALNLAELSLKQDGSDVRTIAEPLPDLWAATRAALTAARAELAAARTAEQGIA